jgi:hypothetical protein
MTSRRASSRLPALAPAAALAALFLVAAAPSEAEAQPHRLGAGFTTGGTWLSDLNPGASANTVAISPGVGAVFGIHADRWYGEAGQIGVRYQAAYQQPRLDWVPGERKINAGSADVSVLYRINAPEEPGELLPYAMVGFGGIWYDLGRGEPTFYGAADSYHDGSSRVLPVVTFGVGVDLDLPWQFQRDLVRVRVEVADHMAIGSPLRQTSTEERYGPVHHVRFSIGLYSALDFRR